MIRHEPRRLGRLPRVLLASAALTVGAGAPGCSDDAPRGGAPPPGVSCSSVATAATSDAAKAAVASAAAGSCVVLTGASFAGPFDVRAGVALVAEAGKRVTITGGTAQAPALSLGEGSVVAGLDVIDAGGVGVAVRAASARLSDVKVTGAKNAALAVLCRESATPGCAGGTVSIEGTSLEKSSLGLWASGAHVVMKGGRSGDHAASTGIAGASGVVAVEGAKLELDGVTVEKNQGTGVLVDGAATVASIKNATIAENAERGVWAQRVAGTLDAPALRIEGTQISKNRITGVGGVAARGIIIVGGLVAKTVATPIATNLSGTEDVGDGVGLFDGSGDLKLEGVALEDNARAAGVFDTLAPRGIIIVGGIGAKVTAGGSGLKLVVQNSKDADVRIPEVDRSTPAAALGVSAPKLTLPSVL